MDGDRQNSTSRAWWLLPLVMGVVGGIIAWEIIRDSDRRKALHILILGIVITVIIVVASTIIAVNIDDDDYDDPLDRFIIPTSELVPESLFT